MYHSNEAEHKCEYYQESYIKIEHILNTAYIELDVLIENTLHTQTNKSSFRISRNSFQFRRLEIYKKLAQIKQSKKKKKHSTGLGEF